MPELSIIVTSYNIENYVRQCLDSICSQTLKDIEIIVVDDGSTDRTPEIVAEFAAKDQRIRPIFLEENTIGGAATPSNIGLGRATAPYVGFADGDDYCEPDMFEKLLNAASTGSHELAMSKYQLLDESTGEFSEPAEVGRWSELSKLAYELDVDTQKQFLRFIAVPWRKIYRRSFLEENGIGFPVGDYFYEDNPFHWFVLTKAKSIAVVPEVLCYHRVARVGQTMATVDERMFRIFMHHDTIRDWLIKHSIEPTFRATLLSWVISQMEWISARTPKELRRKLYDVLNSIFDNYSENDVQKALVEGKKGHRAKVLSDALKKSNFARFNQYLDGQLKASSIFYDGLYHLRYSGVRHTAGLVGRYVSERLWQNIRRGGQQIAGHKTSNVSNEDLMFSIVVLQRNVKRLEETIRRLEERER